jgi:hypothetical protein
MNQLLYSAFLGLKLSKKSRDDLTGVSAKAKLSIKIQQLVVVYPSIPESGPFVALVNNVASSQGSISR